MAVDFPGGASNGISVGNPTNLQITGAMTVMCWMRSDLAQDISILTKFSITRGFSLQTDLDAPPATFGLFFIAPTAATLVNSGWTAAPFVDGQLYHVAGIFRPSTSVEIWVDGQLSNSNTTGIPATQFNGSNSVVIGARSDGGQVIDGVIDDARIYNRALSAEEMSTIHAARGHDGIVDGLVSRWLMNEGAPGVTVAGAGVVKDIGGGGNDGTPQGAGSSFAPSQLAARRVA